MSNQNLQNEKVLTTGGSGGITLPKANGASRQPVRVSTPTLAMSGRGDIRIGMGLERAICVAQGDGRCVRHCLGASVRSSRLRLV